ncbi:MAG: CGNR zinc finger domain-containing protein [Pyrinomonadaceae bacterium]
MSGKFKYIGGDIAVDFVNTVGGWAFRSANEGQIGYRDVVVSDKFENFADLLDWGRGAGVISESDTIRLLSLSKRFPVAAEQVLDRAIRLRRAICRILFATDRTRASFTSDLEVLNTELNQARDSQRLVPAGTAYEFTWPAEDKLDRVLWSVAVAAAALLTTGNLGRIRQCGGQDCGWIFLDTSRNRSRAWCTMKDCGNIAKVRRFRERHDKKSEPRTEKGS